MLTLQRFKIAAVFVVLSVLLIGAVVAYADNHTDDGYITDPGLYWFVSIYDVGFTGRSSLSRHRYTVENDSNYRLEVSWEYSHKVMNPDGTVFIDDSTFDTVTVNGGGFVHGLGGRGVDLPIGMYYLDTYTSIDINYQRKRAGIPKRIKYAKIPEVTGLTEIK